MTKTLRKASMLRSKLKKKSIIKANQLKTGITTQDK